MGTTPPPGGWSDESDPGFNEAYTGTPPRCRAAAASAAAKQEEVRLAVIHATCNERTDPTQRLGAPEAGCQAALVTGQCRLAERTDIFREDLRRTDPILGGRGLPWTQLHDEGQLVRSPGVHDSNRADVE